MMNELEEGKRYLLTIGPFAAWSEYRVEEISPSGEYVRLRNLLDDSVLWERISNICVQEKLLCAYTPFGKSNIEDHKYKFWDANKVAWIFDPNIGRVYADGSLEEDPMSGYSASSLTEALDILNEYGYFLEEEDK